MTQCLLKYTQGCKSGLVKKSETLVILGIALLSANQRPVCIRCSERFQTILITELNLSWF